jgi:hypothetical protein
MDEKRGHNGDKEMKLRDNIVELEMSVFSCDVLVRGIEETNGYIQSGFEVISDGSPRHLGTFFSL